MYVLIWMFNGKRSHSLIAVLATVCAFYSARLKRPSWPVLLATAFSGALVVAIAIGWRGNTNYERSFTGFFQFVGDFKVSKILESLNISDDESDVEVTSYETTEYGGFLLMMDTVPAKSGYDYGANYLRVFSTFIPRIVWPTKPIFGRDQWVNAWIAGSELERDEDFTGPAIGILGATQLNGGAIGTLIVLACVALLLRTAYEYFRLHADVPWVQFWWSITYYNAWFMVVGDDPLVWFYYNWGFTTFPIVVFMWWANAAARRQRQGDIDDGSRAEHQTVGPSSAITRGAMRRTVLIRSKDRNCFLMRDHAMLTAKSDFSGATIQIALRGSRRTRRSTFVGACSRSWLSPLMPSICPGRSIPRLGRNTPGGCTTCSSTWRPRVSTGSSASS